MATTQFRLVFLGSGGVGKTSLVERFVYGGFPRVYSPTVEDIHRHLVQLPGEFLKSKLLFSVILTDVLQTLWLISKCMAVADLKFLHFHAVFGKN